jgi:predicted nucleic acid-binding protein
MIKVKISETARISGDKKDDYLLGLIKAAKADYLITGDLDLLILKNHLKARIISMKQFNEMAH